MPPWLLMTPVCRQHTGQPICAWRHWRRASKVISLTHLGLLDEAALLATCVLDNARQVSDPDTLLRSYVNLSVFYLASGDVSLAAKTLLEQLALFDKFGDLSGLATNLANLGYSYLAARALCRGAQRPGTGA